MLDFPHQTLGSLESNITIVIPPRVWYTKWRRGFLLCALLGANVGANQGTNGNPHWKIIIPTCSNRFPIVAGYVTILHVNCPMKSPFFGTQSPSSLDFRSSFGAQNVGSLLWKSYEAMAP